MDAEALSVTCDKYVEYHATLKNPMRSSNLESFNCFCLPILSKNRYDCSIRIFRNIAHQSFTLDTLYFRYSGWYVSETFAGIPLDIHFDVKY